MAAFSNKEWEAALAELNINSNSQSDRNSTAKFSNDDWDAAVLSLNLPAEKTNKTKTEINPIIYKPTDTVKPAADDKTAVQKENYNKMQELFRNSKPGNAQDEMKTYTEDDLHIINSQIAAYNEIKGKTAAEQSQLINLQREKEAAEKYFKKGLYDEDLSVLDRLQLTAQSIGESYDAAAGVLADTGVQVYKDWRKYRNVDEYQQTKAALAEVTNQINAMQYKINNGFAHQVNAKQLETLLSEQARLQSIIDEKYTTAMDMNSTSVQKMQKAMQKQEKATEGMSNAGAFLWNTGASIAENASLMPLAMLPGGQAAIVALMGAKSAAQKVVEVGESERSAAEALFRGVSSGLIEAATEKIPLDNLVKMAKGPTGKSIIKNMLKQAGTEGTEEVVSYIANTLADIAANDPNAELSFADAMLSFLGGSISGGVMSGGANIIGNRNQQNVADNNVGDNNSENAVINNDFENETAKNVIKNNESAIISENIDTVDAINAVDNTDLQPTAKETISPERQAEIKAFKEAMGIDSRTEVEKETEKQEQRLANAQKWVESGDMSQEDFQKVEADAQEKITEASNRQANLDYQKQDADSGAARQLLIDSGRGDVVNNIEKFTNKRGLKVKYYSADANSDGNGFIDGDTIYINVQDSDVMYKTAIHETIHGLRSNNQAEYTGLYNSIMSYAEQYRYLNDIALQTEEVYTDPNGIAYESILKEDGSIDSGKLGEEVLCKLCEEVIKEPEAFIQNVDRDINVLSTFRDLLRKIKNSLAITLTNSEKAKLDNAVMAIERYIRNDGGKSEQRFALQPYSERQKENWKKSKNIVVFENKQQLDNFIYDAVLGKNLDKKMYFGIISNDIANKVLNDFNINIKNFNCTLRADSILKVLKDHGKEKKEALRGQRAITVVNFVDIPNIIENADSITLSPDLYEGKPVLLFKKDGKTVVAYVSKKHLDLTMQTMYAKKIKTLPLQQMNNSPAITPVANIGTVFTNNSIAKTPTISNGNNLQNNGTQNSGNQNSLSISAGSGNTTIPDELKGLSIRERIEARANSGATVQSKNVQTKAENKLIKSVSNAFGVGYNDKQSVIKELVKNITAEVKATGTVRPQIITALMDTAFSKGKMLDTEFIGQYPNLKKDLRSYKFKYIPSSVFQNVRNTHKGKIFFDKDGMEVDVAYKELNERYPELFEANITNPEDQIERISSVYDMLDARQQSLDDYYGESAGSVREFIEADLQTAINEYIYDINEVANFEADNRRRQKEKAERLNNPVVTREQYEAAQKKVYEAEKVLDNLMSYTMLTEEENNTINTLLAGGNPNLVTGENKNKILAVYAAKKAVQDTKLPIKRYRADIKEKRNVVADDLLTTFRAWKDKKTGLQYSTETMERNIRDIVPDSEEAQRIIDTYITPVHKAEADATRLKNRMRDVIRKLDIDTSTKKDHLYNIELYGEELPIQLTVNESGLVQLLGEKKITEYQVKECGADVEKVKNAVAEFRKIYAELYEMANDSLVRNGYAPLGKIKDYFPHFTEEADTVFSKLAKRAGFDIQTNRIPTSIAGITDTFKPGKKWFANALTRTTDTTVFDAVTGFDQYIEGVSSIIYQTDNIQNLRALENRMRYLAGDKGFREQLQAIDLDDRFTETEKQEKRDKLYEEQKELNLPNFISYLRDYTNTLAGKKQIQDRGIEHDIGRGIYTISKALEGRIASNMIGGNIGSALTNFIPIAQASGEIKNKHMLKAMNETMTAVFGKDNGFEYESDFLTNRFGSDKLVYTWAQKASNVSGTLMTAFDRFTSNVVTRAKYYQNIESGMDEQDALKDADAFAANILADRSKGALPLVFERKNPLIKAVTMFQTEQNNQFRYLLKDLPRDLQDKGKKAILAALLKYAIASFLYNELYEKIVGRRPAFDPIDIGFEAAEDFAGVVKGENKASVALTNTATAVLEEIPFVSGLAGGGRIPISSAIPDITQLIKLVDKDVSAEKKKDIALKELTVPLWYLGLPTAGGQVKKAADAAGLFLGNDGVEYSIEADGDKKAKFAVDRKNVGKIAQTALFGKWSTPEAREYIDNNFKGLTVGQTENFEMFKSWGMSNSEAWEKAKDTTAMSDKQKETQNKLESAGISESEAYNIATTYKAKADKDGNGSIKTDEAKAYIDRLNITKAQKAVLFSAMMPNVKNNPYK